MLREKRTLPKKNTHDEEEDPIPYLENIEKDIIAPSFLSEYAKLESIELIQGAMINEKSHYESFEQLMCIVEGTLEMILVPHIYR